MTKRFCDRCGAEINPRESASYVIVSDKPVVNYIGQIVHIPTKASELCVSCAYHINQWLKGEAE